MENAWRRIGTCLRDETVVRNRSVVNYFVRVRSSRSNLFLTLFYLLSLKYSFKFLLFCLIESVEVEVDSSKNEWMNL